MSGADSNILILMNVGIKHSQLIVLASVWSDFRLLHRGWIVAIVERPYERRQLKG
jgi:hypothetical protein